MAKTKKKCYTFTLTINDGGTVYAFGSKVAFSAKDAKKYSKYILLTDEFQKKFPGVDVIKHSDCGCKK